MVKREMEYNYECENCDIEFYIECSEEMSNRFNYLLNAPVCPLCYCNDDVHIKSKNKIL